MGKERNTGPDYQEILRELEKKDREIENLQKALGDFVIKTQILTRANSILKKSLRLKRWNLQKKS